MSKVTFKEVSEVFETVESINSRNEITEILSSFYKKLEREEGQILSYMILGRVAPFFVKSEFNYSEKSLLSLLDNFTKAKGVDIDIFEERNKLGDIGNTVKLFSEKCNFQSKNKRIVEIYDILWGLVTTQGIGSVERKNTIVLETLQSLSPLEAKYFVRTICGELRLGLSVRSLLDVLSFVSVGDKALKPQLEHAYGVCPDIGYIFSKVANYNEKDVRKNLSSIQVTPGVPILSRLVQRVGSFDELSERFPGSVLLQPKFDGLRCQIHKWDKTTLAMTQMDVVWTKYKKEDTLTSPSLFENEKISDVSVKLFTRNLEDVTEMFPEIVDSARKVKEGSFVLDSEVVGWNYKTNKIMSYQETMQRRRKYSVQIKSTDIPVKAFVFDLLYLNSESLINIDTEKRVEMLGKSSKNFKGDSIVLAETKKVSEQNEIKGYFKECVKNGLEGIIIKQREGGYKPGLRNYEWIKIKKSIDKKLVDTIDMVVVGYYSGSGRRSSLGIGAILGAVLNEKEGTFDAICKVGTGMSDDILKEMYLRFQDIIVKDKPKDVRVSDLLLPDTWVSPTYVVAVDADEITKNISGMNKSIGGGLSLRFPRLIDFGRDKNPEDITTVQELINMYELQKKKR